MNEARAPFCLFPSDDLGTACMGRAPWLATVEEDGEEYCQFRCTKHMAFGAFTDTRHTNFNDDKKARTA